PPPPPPLPYTTLFRSAALVYDYHADGGAERTREGLEALAGLPYDQLLEFELLAVLGYPATVNPLDHGVSPRGYRVLSHIPRLPRSEEHTSELQSPDHL